MLLDKAADCPNHLHLRCAAQDLRAASQTRSEACFFGVLRGGEKSDILAARTARGARWTTENASTGHGENKLAVMGRVAVHNRLPPLVFKILVHGNSLDWIEYGIACHSEPSLRNAFAMDYPDLALKPSSLGGPNWSAATRVFLRYQTARGQDQENKALVGLRPYSASAALAQTELFHDS